MSTEMERHDAFQQDSALEDVDAFLRELEATTGGEGEAVGEAVGARATLDAQALDEALAAIDGVSHGDGVSLGDNAKAEHNTAATVTTDSAKSGDAAPLLPPRPAVAVLVTIAATPTLATPTTSSAPSKSLFSRILTRAEDWAARVGDDLAAAVSPSAMAGDPSMEDAAAASYNAAALASSDSEHEELATAVNDMSHTKSAAHRRQTAAAAKAIADLERESRRRTLLTDMRARVAEATSSPISSAEMVAFYRAYCSSCGVEPLQKFALQVERVSRGNDGVATTASTSKTVSFDLSGCALAGAQTDCIVETVSLLMRGGMCTRLILQFTDIMDDDLVHLLKHLGPTLTWLDVGSAWNLTGRGIRYLAMFLRESSTLRFLDISGVAMDIAGMSLLARVISEQQQVTATQSDNRTPSRSCLEVLKMDGCKLTTAMFNELATSLSSSRIRILSLRNNNINADGAQCIAQLLTNLNTLVKLDVSGNNELRAAGMQRLTLALSSGLATGGSSSLKELYAQNCGLDGLALELIAEMLKRNSNLELLDLSFNTNLCNVVQAMNALKQSLLLNTTLRTLHLDATGLTSASAITLAEVLPETRALRHLTLRENDGALNPLRANMLNLGRVVVERSAVVWRNVRAAVQERVAVAMAGNDSASASAAATMDGLSSPTAVVTQKEAAPPLPSEEAFAALMAFVVAMRANRTVHSLELIDSKDIVIAEDTTNATARTSDIDDEQVISPRQVHALLAELATLCKRNIREAASSPEPPIETLHSIQQQLGAARRDLLLLADLLRVGTSGNGVWSEGEQRDMRELYERCVAFGMLQERWYILDVVRMNETLRDRLVLFKSEMDVTLNAYVERFPMGGEEVNARIAMPGGAAVSTSAGTTSESGGTGIAIATAKATRTTSAAFSLGADESDSEYHDLE